MSIFKIAAEDLDPRSFASIQAAAAACLEAFENCRNAIESRWLIAREADFRLWVASTRADQPAKRSLDAKLELAAQRDAQQVIIGLLTRLSRLLLTGPGRQLDAVGHAAEPYGKSMLLPRGNTSPQTDSSSDDSDAEALTRDEMIQLGIDRIIDQLARIAVVIRWAGNRSRLRIADKKFDAAQHQALRDHLTLILLQQQARVKRETLQQRDDQWQSQNRNRPDRDAQIDLSGLVYSALEYTFSSSANPPALTEIQERLVEVNLRRRNRFIQARPRQQPKPANIESPAKVELPAKTSVMPAVVKPVLSTMQDVQPTERSQQGVPIRPTPSIDKQSTRISEISALPQLAPIVEVSRLAPTQITTTANKLSYPCPPKFHEDAKTFECPSCCQVLGVDVASERDRWKKHVIRDVLPYSCILLGCDTPFETFLSKQEWKSHLLDRHRVGSRWFCSICDEKFNTKASFESHVVRFHEEVITDSTLSLMVDTCREQALDLEACPLCQWPVNGVDLEVLLDHLAQEMHDFALRSLPTTAERRLQPRPHKGDANELFDRPSDTLTAPDGNADPLTFANLRRHEAELRPLAKEMLTQTAANDEAIDTGIWAEELPDPHYAQHPYFQESDVGDHGSSAETRSSMDEQFSGQMAELKPWCASDKRSTETGSSMDSQDSDQTAESKPRYADDDGSAEIRSSMDEQFSGQMAELKPWSASDKRSTETGSSMDSQDSDQTAESKPRYADDDGSAEIRSSMDSQLGGQTLTFANLKRHEAQLRQSSLDEISTHFAPTNESVDTSVQAVQDAIPEYGSGPLRLLSRGILQDQFQFNNFTFENAPPFCFVSRTWSRDSPELTYYRMRGELYTQSQLSEVVFSLDLAERRDCEYVFMDSYCIDRRIREEMTQYFTSSITILESCAACLVYLSDVDDRSKFESSSWFTRCSTIQELVVPQNVTFFNRHRHFIGTKHDLHEQIQAISGIDVMKSLAETPMAERFTWSKDRHATSVLDKLACLIGLFDVQVSFFANDNLWSVEQRLIAGIRSKYGEEVASSIEPWAAYDLDNLALLDRHSEFQILPQASEHYSFPRGAVGFRYAVRRIMFLQKLMKDKSVLAPSVSWGSLAVDTPW